MELPSRTFTLTLDSLFLGTQRLRVSVENQGEGIPLLLINGIGATGDLFDPLRQHLQDRETIAYDAPGVGGSPAAVAPMPMCVLATQVARMIGRLGHDEVDVLGVSWGGALALELARRRPRLVRRLVLAATAPGWGGVLGRPGPLSILMSPARYYSPNYLRRVAPTLYGGGIADRPDLLESHVVLRSRHAPSLRGYLHQLLAIQTWSALPYLPFLRTPTLVLVGDDDPIVPAVNGTILAGCMADAHLHVVEGGGHLFLFVRAAEVAEVVTTFLDVPASSAPD